MNKVNMTLGIEGTRREWTPDFPGSDWVNLRFAYQWKFDEALARHRVCWKFATQCGGFF